MGRLIDADEYEKRIKPYDTEDIMDKALYNFAHTKLLSTPTARPKGKWILYEGYKGAKWFLRECPFCHSKGWTIDMSFCPDCGAEMETE